MMVTLDQLARIMPNQKRTRIGLFLDPINAAMDEFDIGTRARMASYLAQVAHESLQLSYTCEIASGVRYEGRLDLGNTQPGDGPKFKGRGLLQITGRDNYAKCGADLGLPLLDHPDLLELPQHAARSSGWYWKHFNLNELADIGDQRAVTKRINGGYNGLPERLAFFNAAERALA